MSSKAELRRKKRIQELKKLERLDRIKREQKKKRQQKRLNNYYNSSSSEYSDSEQEILNHIKTKNKTNKNNNYNNNNNKRIKKPDDIKKLERIAKKDRSRLTYKQKMKLAKYYEKYGRNNDTDSESDSDSDSSDSDGETPVPKKKRYSNGKHTRDPVRDHFSRNIKKKKPKKKSESLQVKINTRARNDSKLKKQRELLNGSKTIGHKSSNNGVNNNKPKHNGKIGHKNGIKNGNTNGHKMNKNGHRNGNRNGHRNGTNKPKMKNGIKKNRYMSDSDSNSDDIEIPTDHETYKAPSDDIKIPTEHEMYTPPKPKKQNSMRKFKQRTPEIQAKSPTDNVKIPNDHESYAPPPYKAKKSKPKSKSKPKPKNNMMRSISSDVAKTGYKRNIPKISAQTKQMIDPMFSPESPDEYYGYDDDEFDDDSSDDEYARVKAKRNQGKAKNLPPLKGKKSNTLPLKLRQSTSRPTTPDNLMCKEDTPAMETFDLDRTRSLDEEFKKNKKKKKGVKFSFKKNKKPERPHSIFTTKLKSLSKTKKKKRKKNADYSETSDSGSSDDLTNSITTDVFFEEILTKVNSNPGDYKSKNAITPTVTPITPSSLHSPRTYQKLSKDFSLRDKMIPRDVDKFKRPKKKKKHKHIKSKRSMSFGELQDQQKKVLKLHLMKTNSNRVLANSHNLKNFHSRFGFMSLSRGGGNKVKLKPQKIKVSQSVTNSPNNSPIVDNTPITPISLSNIGTEISVSSRRNKYVEDSDEDKNDNVNHLDVKGTSIVTTQSAPNLMPTIDRYGFVTEHFDEKEHRKQVRKDIERLGKWEKMLFGSSNKGYNSGSISTTHKKFKARIRKNGIPQRFRSIVWKTITNSIAVRENSGDKNIYKVILKNNKTCQYDEIIWKDIKRIFISKQVRFTGYGKKNANETQHSLYNVLKVFSIYRKDIGYCQGMQQIAALLTMHMDEEDAFWVLLCLANESKYNLQEVWKPAMPGIKKRFFQMNKCIENILPKLYTKLVTNGISSPSMYQATQWFLTIFLATEMPFNIQLHIFDIYLHEGIKTIFRMGLGLLKYNEKELLSADFENMLTLFRTGANKLIHQKYIDTCFSFKLTHNQLNNYQNIYDNQH